MEMWIRLGHALSIAVAACALALNGCELIAVAPTLLEGAVVAYENKEIENLESMQGPGVTEQDLQKVKNLGFLIGSDLIGKDDPSDIALASAFGAKFTAVAKEYGFPVTEREAIEQKMKSLPQNGSEIDRMVAAGRDLGLQSIITGKFRMEELKVKSVLLTFWGMDEGKRVLLTVSVTYKHGLGVEDAAQAVAQRILKKKEE